MGRSFLWMVVKLLTFKLVEFAPKFAVDFIDRNSGLFRGFLRRDFLSDQSGLYGLPKAVGAVPEQI